MEWFSPKKPVWQPAGAPAVVACEEQGHQADMSLRHGEALYRFIISTLPEGYWLVNVQGRVLEVNDAYCQLSGYTRAELLGMSLSDLEAMETPEQTAVHIQRIIAAGYDRFETRHRRKDGSLLDVEVIVRYLPLKGGLFVCFTHDISDRKQAETELRRREEEFRLVFEHSIDAIFWADAATGIIINCNRKAETLTERTRAELIGMHQIDLHPPEEAGFYAELFQQAATQSHFPPIEAQIWSRTGRSTPVLISTSIIQIGERTIIQGIFHDITERKRAEEERLEMERRLLHAQRLESLGIMAGGMAHDFNNLLMIILGNLDLAATAFSPVSTAHASIEQAIHAAQRAADLTRQILAYCGKGRFIIKALDLTELVKENIPFFHSIVPKSVTLQLALDPKLPPIRADAGQIQQVIVNLITNAAESVGEQGGIITVTTSVEHYNPASLRHSRLEEKPATGDFVYLQIADTGCGMDEETKRRLFDPFFTTKFTGRGLGLSAVLGIVRGHGGAIFIDSEVARGTTIKVAFPVVTPAGV